jgi:hypothetical protein
MMYLAEHDEINAIVRRYDNYKLYDSSTKATPIAEAAQAAHDVLVAIYPVEAVNRDALLHTWLDQVHSRRQALRLRLVRD